MDYDLRWKPQAEQEFNGLDNAIKKQVYVQFKKLKNSPQLGLPLGKKAGLDLTGYRKLYFYRKKFRIVYRLNEKSKRVIIFSIGPREDMEVYREVIRRLESEF